MKRGQMKEYFTGLPDVTELVHGAWVRDEKQK